MAPPRYHARYDSAPPTVLKAVGADARKLSFTTLLTYPVIDLDGDYVQPDGCRFHLHERDPVIDLEHRRDPLVKGRPVAWASPSFGRERGDYSVYWKAINFGTEAEPEVHRSPIGVEYYDPADRLSSQVFALREQDILRATSLEFSAVAGKFRVIGKAQLRTDPPHACHFYEIDVHRWTACQAGVNEWALTGSVEKSLLSSQVPTPLGKILADKRISVGGVLEPLCEVLQKALSVPRGTSRTVVPLRLKAMPKPFDDEDDGADEGAAVATAGDDADLDDSQIDDADLTTPGEDAIQEQADANDAQAHPSVQATYEAAGAIVDACEHLKTAAKATESKEIYRDLNRMCQQIEKLAAQLKTVGDKHDSSLQAMKSGKASEPAEGDENADETPDDSDSDSDDLDEDEIKKALARDPDDVLTNIPRRYKKAIVLRRLTAAELAPEPVKKAPAAKRRHDDDTRAAALEARIDTLTRLLTAN